MTSTLTIVESIGYARYWFRRAMLLNGITTDAIISGFESCIESMLIFVIFWIYEEASERGLQAVAPNEYFSAFINYWRWWGAAKRF